MALELPHAAEWLRCVSSFPVYLPCAITENVLDENEVVDAVCIYLEATDHKIIQRCTTNDKGIDIIATLPSGSGRLLVEAKGGKSSKPGSPRFGTRQTRQMPLREPHSVGKSTSLVLRCSTCRGLPPKVRRTCSICRPASMLASRPCSRRRWRRVCSLTESRSVPATVCATS